MPSTKKNALDQLGSALSSYLKTTAEYKGNKQKPTVSHSKHKIASRHYEYSEQHVIQSTNCLRFRIVHPDGTMVNYGCVQP